MLKKIPDTGIHDTETFRKIMQEDPQITFKKVIGPNRTEATNRLQSQRLKEPLKRQRNMALKTHE